MLIDFGDQVTALEIKSGATLNADFFQGLEDYQHLAKEQVKQSYLVYGGDQYQTREVGPALPWRMMTNLTRSLEG